MTANPIDVIIVDGAAVNKSDIRSYEKNRVRQRMADPTEVRNTKLSGQFAGIYVRSLQNSYDLDTTDTTTSDDGVNCIIDFDGNRFKKVTVSTITTRAQRIVTASGAVTAAPTDDIIIINKTSGAATTVNVDWSAQTRPLTIVDGKGDAGTNNITIVPSAGQTQYGIANYQVIIDGNGGQVTLTPLSGGTGAF
jgi:hypothetical protein